MTDSAQPTSPAEPGPLDIVKTARQAMGECARPDLEQRLGVALARATRPATVVCVVGEFKQGKSSLVNALLGGDACPVDDDLATSVITVVTAGEKPQVIVHRRQDGKPVAGEIHHRQLREHVTEQGNPDNERGVERVEIRLKHPLLAKGLTVVDSPGMGGLGAGSAASTLAFLPYADALLFVSDASAELSAPEIEFLRTAGDLCPTVLFCLTKTDLYPSWRRIAELDAGHLERSGVPLAGGGPVPLASPLRMAAFEHNDRALSEESGYQRLLALIDREVMTKAKDLAVGRALHDAAGAVDQVRSAYEAELTVLQDPEGAGATETVQALEAAKARLEHLRGPAARWSIVLNDRMADLSSEASHRFRGALRTVNRSVDDRIEALETTEDWEQLSRDLQTAVSGAVADVFADLEAGAERTRQELAELLGDEVGELRVREGLDVGSLWQDKSIKTEGGVSGAVMSGFSILRGAQGGMMMFGMMGRFLPAAASAVLLSNPVTIGLGAVFAGQALLDQRKRRLAGQRQQARQAARQFVDEVQFEVGNELSELVRAFQRQLRDDVGERLAELQRTTTDAAKAASEALAKDAQTREAQAKDLTNRVRVLAGLGDRLRAAAP